MHKLYLVLSFFLFTNLLSAQDEISIDSVSSYVGKSIKVCDKVVGTFVTKATKPLTFLNLGTNYPNTKLTIVIFQSDLQHFDFVPSDHYNDMNVCVTGEIGLYKEKPQIIINKPEQIEIK